LADTIGPLVSGFTYHLFVFLSIYITFIYIFFTDGLHQQQFLEHLEGVPEVAAVCEVYAENSLAAFPVAAVLPAATPLASPSDPIDRTPLPGTYFCLPKGNNWPFFPL
jgi:hypothetical protein